MAIKDLWGPPRVGGDILSFCAKCKMELAHVIVAMVDGGPAKVICKTCHSQHGYKRSHSANPRRATPTGQRPRLKTSTTATRLWEEKVSANKSPTRIYDVKDSFNLGDLINHNLFGVGVVEEVRGRKMVVLFREGEKVLIHGQT